MQFIVETRPSVAFTPEIIALVPTETARGKELDAEGRRLHFFAAADQSGGWQIFQADSRAELDSLLGSFPLHKYVTEIVTQLSE